MFIAFLSTSIASCRYSICITLEHFPLSFIPAAHLLLSVQGMTLLFGLIILLTNLVSVYVISDEANILFQANPSI